MDKKLYYKKSIVKHLFFSNALSYAELTEQTGKSLPLVTGVLSELLEEGKVLETGYAPSTGGRRRSMYALRPDCMYVVSIAMDQFITRMAITDMEKRMIGDVEEFELHLDNDRSTLDDLADKVDRLIAQKKIDKSCIVGVGVGMPGFVDIGKGVNYSFFDASRGSIVDHLSNRLQLPVYIDNDSSIIALAELRFGAARGRRTAMVINIGWGIGLGLVLNRELFRGENGFAGEFSHLPLFLNGKLCGCGKRGCLETESSLLVVLEKAREGLALGHLSLLKSLSTESLESAIEELFEAAKQGDQFVIGLLSEAGYSIGRGAAVLIHLLNPEIIVLSGIGAEVGGFLQTPIQQALNEHCIPRLAAGASVQISNLGKNAAIIGAAALVMDHYCMPQ